jgi:hypothetical protein
MTKFEKVPRGEAAYIDEITTHFLTLQRRFADEEGLPLQRGTHAKGVACRAVFEVFDLEESLDDAALARRLQHGPFARRGAFPAVVRFANAEGRVQSDEKPDVRAVSFSAVMSDGTAGEQRADFSMNNTPTFAINDIHDFAVLMRILAAPSARARLGVMVRLTPREWWHFIKTAVRGGRQKAGNKGMAYQTQRYWSNVPFQLGPDTVVKYSVIPRRYNHQQELGTGPSRLRNEFFRHLMEDTPTASFDFAVQILDTGVMKHRRRKRDAAFWVENASVEWDEKQAPFHVVGRLSLEPASALTPEETVRIHMDVHKNRFEDFRPIGGINRGRQKPEEESWQKRWADEQEVGESPVVVGSAGRPGGWLPAIPLLGPLLAPIARVLGNMGRVPLGRVLRLGALGLAGLLGIVFLASAATAWYMKSGRAMLPDEAPDVVVYPEQGWGDGLEAPGRQTYYYTSQGASLRGIRYEWFVNLELPLSRRKLASPDLMRRYGFIVDPATPNNPDQLPVGFTRHYDERLDEEVLSITCATCHTGELHRTQNGITTAYRVDGGQANHAFTDTSLGNFVPTILASMVETVANPFKFNRFARSVLGDAYPDGKGALRGQMLSVIRGVLRIGWNERKLTPTQEGYGRTDALARISNTVFGENLDLENMYVGNAPVSYPPVWNIWKFDWVQYSASVSQPMARNFGEALGVGATYALMDRYGRPLPYADRFGASVLIHNLNEIEHTLRDLEPPTWPEHLFGPINAQLAERGEELFNQHCVECHGPFEAPDLWKARNAPEKGPDDPEWIMNILCTDDVGTDPHAAQNFALTKVDITRTGLTADDLRRVAQENLAPWVARTRIWYDAEIARIEGELPGATGQEREALLADLDFYRGLQAAVAADSAASLAGFDPEALPLGLALSFVGTMMRDLSYQKAGLDSAQVAEFDGFGISDLPQVVAGYKPRPLAGIWATPPYLHNGSVATIYELLSPREQRRTRFLVGSREFNPDSLGLAVPAPGKWFEFDTRLPGNWNTGHEFRDGYVPWTEGSGPARGIIGPLLTHDERMAIIEHLKVRRDSGDEVQQAGRPHKWSCPVIPPTDRAPGY